MTLIALVYFAVFGIVTAALSARYLWSGRALDLSCPTGLARSACLIKRALQAMGRVASGVVLTLAAIVALIAMAALYDGRLWAVPVLVVLGMLTGMSVAVQMRERGAAQGEHMPWHLPLGLTLGLPVVGLVAVL